MRYQIIIEDSRDFLQIASAIIGAVYTYEDDALQRLQKMMSQTYFYGPVSFDREDSGAYLLTCDDDRDMLRLASIATLSPQANVTQAQSAINEMKPGARRFGRITALA